MPAGAASAAKPSTESRYSLVHGCFALATGDSFVAKSGGGYAATATGAGAAEPFRMQATDLGTYLLYGKAGDFLAAGSGDSVVVAEAPGPAAEWVVDEAGGDGFTLGNLATGKGLAAAPGGAVKQGAVVDRELRRRRGLREVPGGRRQRHRQAGQGQDAVRRDARVLGPAHAHDGLRGVRRRPSLRPPVAPLRRPARLARLHGRSTATPASNFVNWGSPVDAHDPVGWPTFKDWPNHHSLTYEQTYYKWLERSWMGGMRLAVNLFVDNRAFCEVLAQPQNRRYECNEMATVRKEATAIYAMQDYIDAQAGGPGKGFFRIVTDPFEARRGDQRRQARGRARDRGLRALRVHAALRGRRSATSRTSTPASTSSTTSASATSSC